MPLVYLKMLPTIEEVNNLATTFQDRTSLAGSRPPASEASTADTNRSSNDGYEPDESAMVLSDEQDKQ